MSPVQKRELWSRWKDGQTITEIGLALCKAPGSIHGVLSDRGGIAPLVRQRADRALSLSEREEVSRGVALGSSCRLIARQLGRSPSTITRELERNGGRNKYRAAIADERSWKQALRPKECRLRANPELATIVATKLAMQWSPQQIAGWLKASFGHDPTMTVSHETIYRSLFIQARGVLKRELIAHLRSRRMMRRAKNATTKGQPRGQIIDAVSIRERPAEVEDRAVPGHWEGDMISGSKNSHIATLVERHSRYVMLVKLEGKDTSTVVTALIDAVARLPEGLMASLTWDRGSELASHKAFSIATDVSVYFCDPRSPWQRGSNENTNGLLRQYFPKGTSLASYSQADLDAVAMRLNTRPRKTLGYRTPSDTLASSVAVTG